MQAWHACEISDVAASLKTDPDSGLEPAHAGARLLEHGPNLIPASDTVTLWAVLVRQFTDFMVLVLLVAATVSLALGERSDALAIVAIVLVNALLGFLQEYKAERALAALSRLAPPRARCRRGLFVVEIPSIEVVPGDLLILTAGDKVAADARLTRCWELRCDESALTGESLQAGKELSVLAPETALAERKNMVFGGTLITGGKAEALVVATGLQTETGKIAAMLGQRKSEPILLQRRLDQLGRMLVVVCIAVCAAVVVLGFRRGGHPLELVMAGISLAVAAIPEGLPAIVTLSLAVGVQRMTRRRVIIRSLPAVETLGCTSVICADKTGTLTENRMTVREIQSFDSRLLLLSSALCNDATLKRAGLPLTAAWRGRAEPGRWTAEGDPTEAALSIKAAELGLNRGYLEQRYPRLDEVPFDSERKLMSTLHQWEKGTRLIVKGAPDIIIERCQKLHKGANNQPGFNTGDRADWLAQTEKMASSALRVLAVAYRDFAPDWRTADIEMENDLILIGLVGLNDPPKRGVGEAIWRCRQAGIRTVMITGDHRNTAVAIARELGLAWHGGVATGADIDRWDRRELERRARDINVYARVSPRHKLNIVSALKKQGEVVAMTGDGINDAPAIKEADIGIAMGRAGTDVARETAAMVIEDDNFATIVAAVEEGRAVYANIRKFIRYLLSSNIGEIATMLFAALLGLPLPLLPIQILWVNLLTDGLPALALGFDPPAIDLMFRPPRGRMESVFSGGLGRKIFRRGLVIGLVTISAFSIGLRAGNLALARTLAFCVLVMQQLFYVLECRSENRSLFELGVFGNKYLLLAVFISTVLQLAVVHIPALQGVFYTVALTANEWSLVMLVAGYRLVGQGFVWLLRWTDRHPLDIMNNNT